MKFIEQKGLLILALFLLINNFAIAQKTPIKIVNKNIPTGVPMLLIGPDSRAGGMGDLGGASSPDANSIHWNNAKYAFVEDDLGFSLSYSPWMRNLTADMNLAYLSGYKKITNASAMAISFRYFDLGSIQFYDEMGTAGINHSPYEMAVDATYAMKFSDKLSGAVSGRFILSDITAGQDVAGMATHAGTAGAADIGLYWVDKIGKERGKEKMLSDEYALGLSISNLGSKISYSDDFVKDFLPTNLRLGGRYTMNMDEYNQFSFLLDLNKFLVPTPPLKDKNENIVEGMESNVGIIKGLIQSFYDAPGGFSEEMQEIFISPGVEYWYDKKLAVRAGYFYESAEKGNRQYFTLGAGIRYNLFGLDVSYLIPVTTNNALQNTLRFTLMVDFASVKK